MSSEIPFARLDIDCKSVLEAMGYPACHLPSSPVMKRLEELVKQSTKHCNPTYSYTLFNGTTDDSCLYIEPFRFRTGKRIARALHHCEQFALFVATAGEAYQEWAKEYQSDIIAQFITDSIGSVIVEAAADYMEEEIAINVINYTS